jgi:LDH2 family malate/lactate/ureidoglycolate dehydrogenase
LRNEKGLKKSGHPIVHQRTGDQRARRAQRRDARDGIPIAPALMRSLDQLADELGMAKLG